MSAPGVLTLDRSALLKEMLLLSFFFFFFFFFTQAPVSRAPLPSRARQVDSPVFRAMRALDSSWQRASWRAVFLSGPRSDRLP